MKEQARTWIAFAACGMLLLGAMGFVTVRAVSLEGAEARARAETRRQETMRLALWRMDSWMTALIAREAARPWFHYHSFFSAERPYSTIPGDINLDNVRPDEPLAASPLLLERPEGIRLYFQVTDNQMSSPQTAKTHVAHGLAILSETPGFDAEILRGIEQHHERMNGSGYPRSLVGEEIGVFGRMSGIVDCFAALTNHRPYAAAVSSYEALRNITAWGGEFFHEALVQQFVSSVGVFPVGSLIELSSGEVAVVVEHSKVRRLKPRVLVVTGPDKTPATFPTMVDLLYDPKMGGEAPAFIKRGLAPGAYGLNLADFYLA